MRTDFAIDIHDGPGRVVLRPRGELDLASADALVQQASMFLADSSGTLVVDLSELEFMDSTGLRSLLTIQDLAVESGHRLVVVRGNRQIQRLLELTRVCDVLELVSAPEEAA